MKKKVSFSDDLFGGVEQLPIVNQAIVPKKLKAPPIIVNVSPRFQPKQKPTPYVDPFLAHHKATLDAAGNAPLTFDEATWEDLPKQTLLVDTECFENFFLVCVKRVEDGKRLAFEMSGRRELDKIKLSRLLCESLIITFNGSSYDLPIITLALRDASFAELRAASDRIIKGNMKPWQVERELGIQIPRYNHVDLLEPNPSVRASLKLIAARLHARFVVDLPFAPDARLTPREMNIATLYCMNDLDDTGLLFDALHEPYELRRALSNEYKMDLRSKSDAQIGEAIVKKRVEMATDLQIRRVDPRPMTFRYVPPAFISFSSGTMQRVLDDLRGADFSADASGNITPPEWLKEAIVNIGSSNYSMGIGGLHSQEAHRAVFSDADNRLIDLDVASQYPSIIVKLGLYPAALGPRFLDIYDALRRERLEAKANKNKAKADGLKIALNGVFGKTGSAYSPLYAPNLMIAITLTGQLSLLMLIERLEDAGIPVVSGNTDGVVARVPRSREDDFVRIRREWEEATGFEIEATPYRALYSSSVNTYIAIKEDGKAKRKGFIADPWGDNDARGMLSKNPQMTALSEAVLRLARDKTPIEETISACKDPRMFLTAIRVTGGAVWRGAKLGRVMRYYWSTNGEPILYADGKRKVAKTDGAHPLMELTDVLPLDLDLSRYVLEAKSLAEDLAIIDPEKGLFR